MDVFCYRFLCITIFLVVKGSSKTHIIIIIIIIIHNKNKRNLCSMSVFISDKDTAKLYVQFFRPK